MFWDERRTAQNPLRDHQYKLWAPAMQPGIGHLGNLRGRRQAEKYSLRPMNCSAVGLRRENEMGSRRKAIFLYMNERTSGLAEYYITRHSYQSEECDNLRYVNRGVIIGRLSVFNCRWCYCLKEKTGILQHCLRCDCSGP